MKNTINRSDQFGTTATDEQQTNPVQIDYELEQLPYTKDALLRVVSIQEITKTFEVMIDLVSDYGLRACFAVAGRQWGYVVIREPGNGSVAIEADTVLQDLENRSQSCFEVDSFSHAAAWIRHLGVTLATLDQSWGCTQIDHAAEVRMRRLKAK